MEENKQKQIAGNNSTQIQAGIVQNFVINGIDEARARAICREEYAVAKQTWTSEAYEIADRRVRDFEDILMPKMVQYDNSLKFFADPSFQFTLRKAQIAAASSERTDDYNLLSELLVNRIAQNSNRVRRLGIVKAIEVVDQIDDNALVGLSIVYAIAKIHPKSLLITDGLTVLNRLFSKIISGRQLPRGLSWIEHLDLISAIRISDKQLHHFKKIEEFTPVHYKHYFERGILEDSEEFRKLAEKFRLSGLNTNSFVSHPLRKGYLYWASSRDVEQIVIAKQVGDEVIRFPLNDEQKAVIQEALSIACEDGSKDQEIINAFWQEWNKYEHLNIVHNWWNNIEGSFEFTPVGVALANAYIHGKDPSVPCIY